MSIILIPLIKINLKIRVLKKKEDKRRYRERFGITSLKRPKGKLIWIHATSIGEFKSAITLINKFYKKINILVTTTTLSSANFAKSNYGDKIIHQYAPLDIESWVEIFLDNWKPNLSIWIESDLWPNTINLIKKNRIKSILLNLRISPKSFNRWFFFKNFYKKMLDTFDHVYAQSLLDQKRIIELSGKNIKYIGNLKLSLVENKKNTLSKYKYLKKNLQNNEILLLASTHNKEEEILSSLIKKLLRKNKKLKIIIAPRHPERTNYIKNNLKKDMIDSSIITKNSKLNKRVLILNTFGEMAFYFSVSNVVFLGGSLVEMGGHNPIEPASNNCAIIVGPHIYNWENIYKDMENFGACIISNHINEIEKSLESIYNNKKKMNTLKIKAKKFSRKKFFEDKIIYSIINKFISSN